MSPAGGFKKRLDEFSRKKYAVPIGLALTIVITTLLLVFLWYECFSLILIAIVAYAIPFYLGLKNRKKLALFGVVLFIILGLAFTASSFYTFKGFEGSTVGSDNNILINGKVAPYQGDASTTYAFSVLFVGDNGTGQVWTNISNVWPGDVDSINETMVKFGPEPGGYVFVLNKTLPKGIYQYHFVALSGSDYVRTSTWAIGPLAVSDEVLFEQLLYTRMVVVWLEIGTLFYMILALTWWMDSSKKRTEELRKRMEEDKKTKDASKQKIGKESAVGKPGTKKKTVEKFVCSECGEEVPADAKKCPRCGEPFEEEAELICTSCGAKVKESDKKCWNCGKEFEN
jgi:ribosomal protein L40E/energy-coupling factor transporter transmembrane protein EcfT